MSMILLILLPKDFKCDGAKQIEEAANSCDL